MDKINAGYDTIIGIGYVFTKDISSMTELAGGMVRVIFSGGGTWNDFPFTPGTAFFKEAKDKSGAGVFINQQFSAMTVKDVQSDYDLLDELMRRRVVLRLVYKDSVRIVGQLTTGIDLDVESNNQSGQGVKISFERKSLSRSLWEAPLESEDSGSGSGF